MVRRSRETYPQIQCDEAEEGSFQILENKVRWLPSNLLAVSVIRADIGVFE